MLMLSNSIFKLREANRLSQKEFADLFDVSAQAVQKWENNSSYPTIANLVAISKYFNVSIDSLLLDTNGRVIEEMSSFKEIFPNFDAYELYSENIKIEYLQSIDEGYDIEHYQDLFAAVDKIPNCREKEKIADAIFNIVMGSEKQTAYRFTEPSELTEIKPLRKEHNYTPTIPDEATLKSKIAGAWYGRICGCLLGKPIEGIRTNEFIPLLKETDNYPMHRYILSTDITNEICEKYNYNLKDKCWADVIDCAPIDDDTNYTVLAQQLIERFGKDFTSADIGRLWLSSQPKVAYYTAERVAFRNLVNGYAPPYSAIYKNPYREWIGAQIRGDYFGYINPGNPELAAEMAWRDASVSHIKNGIYGEMFVAAMLATAAVTDNIFDIIYGGLAQIPQTSRLYHDVTSVIEDYNNNLKIEDCYAKIHTKYDEYSEHGWCHTISNAMIVVAALLYGKVDYGKSICLAVQTGFDTDCNGATVGSVIGMQKGLSAIDEKWIKPLNGVLNTSIFGIGKIQIIDLIDKTVEHIKR